MDRFVHGLLCIEPVFFHNGSHICVVSCVTGKLPCLSCTTMVLSAKSGNRVAISYTLNNVDLL